MTKFWKTLGGLTLVAGLALLAMLWLTALAQEPVNENAVAQPALPADRVRMYNALLQKTIRTEAYLIAPDEDIAQARARLELGPNATEQEIEAAVAKYYADFYAHNNKVSRPNNVARLGRMKAVEIAEARRAAGDLSATAMLTGTPEVLTVMMNFTGVETYTFGQAVALNGTCLTDTTVYSPTFEFVIDGPSFNEIAQPTDNWTPWLDPDTSYTGGFTKEYFDLLMFSTTGYTAPMRPELPNPWDGGTGFDFSGVSFRNWYAENSRGVYIPQGEVIETNIPVAVSYFGAGDCSGRVQDDSFYDNRPRYTVAISAADQINAENPSFDWEAWDQEDVFDYDNDGDFQEADGYVDHFFLLEAGEAQGGKYGEFLIWPHSWDVRAGAANVGPAGNQLGGYQVMSNTNGFGGVWVLNYTVSDEVGGLGVLVHEYGHDIGLPDNYAGDGNDSNAGFWDQMSSGTFGGALSGMHPTHHTIWDKAEPYLGWNEPVIIDINTTTAVGEENAITYTVGQQSIPPAGTIDGLRINLPDVETYAFVEPFGTMMWWSDQGDDRQESIAKALTVQAGETVTITTNLAYHIEANWDYLYWEFSTDGESWTQLSVYDVSSGTVEITTDTDPNGNNPTGNGVTDATAGWITATASITPGQYSGTTLHFRFRYFTDAGLQEEGVYLDNISIEGSASGNLVSDDAEGADTWTHMSEGVNTEAPWYLFSGVSLAPNYYLVEWRNSGEGTGFNGVSTEDAFATAGFDIGLNRMYWVNQRDEHGYIAMVDRFPTHTPGMLVWFADGEYSDNNIDSYWFDPTYNPAFGPKGRILLVDANPYPYLVEGIDDDGNPIEIEVGARRSSFDAAFTLNDRPAFILGSTNVQGSAALPTVVDAAIAQPAFHDRIGDSADLEAVATGIGENVGVVLPSVGNVPYHYARTLPYTPAPTTGNPGLNAFGVNLEVIDQAGDGTWGVVKFWMDDDSIFVDKRASHNEVIVGDVVTYTIYLKDAAGTRWTDRLNYTFTASLEDAIPAGMTYVTGSLSITGPGGITVIPVPNSPGTAQIVSDTLTWDGTLGANRRNESDAIIQYAVTVDTAGCYGNAAVLTVNQQTITDTFRNDGVGVTWPKHDTYTDTTTVCAVVPNWMIYLPVVLK